jgi:3-oxoadipate enol-lactonase
MAADVERLLVELGEPPLHVAGLSLGACVGLALAGKAPARVRSLTLVNGFARLRPAGAGGMLRMLARLALVATAPMTVVAARVAGSMFPRPEQAHLRRAAARSLARTPRWTYVAALAALARFDARPRLTSVRCPTLVVAGDGDATVALEAKEELARGIEGARLVVVPDSGHATPADQPEVFNRMVLEFIGAH